MIQRLQKIIADSGLMARRKAEEAIRAGRVTVNGLPVQLGDSADRDRDRILVDGRELPRPEEKVYIMLNKPRGVVCSLHDEKGRRDVTELVRELPERLFPVGRLDMDSEGLLLFTNDGALMQALIHPRHEVNKVYRVTVSGDLTDAISRLSAITDLDGEPIRPARVEELSRSGGQAVLQITIHEGKNRQIRRMCRKVGLQVVRLMRIQEGSLLLGELPAGKWRYLTDNEIRELKGSD